MTETNGVGKESSTSERAAVDTKGQFWEPPRPLRVLQAQKAGTLTELLPRDPRAKRSSAASSSAPAASLEVASKPASPHGDLDAKRPRVLDPAEVSRIASIYDKPMVSTETSQFTSFVPSIPQSAPPPSRRPMEDRHHSEDRRPGDRHDYKRSAESSGRGSGDRRSSEHRDYSDLYEGHSLSSKQPLPTKKGKLELKNKPLGIKKGPKTGEKGFVPRIVCKYWMEGKCYKGSTCTFSHAVEPKVPLPEEQSSRQEICQYYRLGNCLRGSQCLYSHDLRGVPCRYWHTNGRCKDGSTCRFSHDPLNEEGRRALETEIALARKTSSGDKDDRSAKSEEQQKEGGSDESADEDLIRSLVNPMFQSG